MKRLVFDKAEQVHETAVHLIEDETKLTGVSVARARPIYPIIAVGSSFARNPIVTTMIDNHVKDRDLLSHADPLIKPLSVIDMGEVEMLEGLAATRGCGISDLLDGWHKSGIANMSLRNYLISTFPDHRDVFRAPRLRERVDAATEEMLRRLGLVPAT